MHVLVCDDDASTRFAARRLLEQHLDCVVHEAPGGAEALTMLGQRRYTFLLLDVDMPGLSGHETLEEIRVSDMTRSLPVIVLSAQRREHEIIKLMQLGIADYILKPIRPETFTAKIEAFVQRLPRSIVEAVDAASILVRQDNPALIADGNLDFRFFFSNCVGRFGPVIQAESGAAALAAFKQSPSGVVFIGDDLGVVTPERLAVKIRETGTSDVRIVRITNRPQDVSFPSDRWDGVLKRTFLPETLRAGIRPFVFIPGALFAINQFVPKLTEMIEGVTANVFGTMFNSEVTKSTNDGPVAVNYTSTLDVSLLDRFAVRVGIHLPKAAAAGAAGHLLGMPDHELEDEDLQSVTGELANLLSGRLHARFREGSLPSSIGLPSVSVGPTFAKPDESNGEIHRYVLPSSGDFFLSITVIEKVSETKIPSKSAETTGWTAATAEVKAPAAAQPVPDAAQPAA